MNLILLAVISLGAIGLIAAVILYVASKKFAVYEDPRIAQVAEVLPQANCGGCGFPGCAGFASACVKAADAGSFILVTRARIRRPQLRPISTIARASIHYGRWLCWRVGI